MILVGGADSLSRLTYHGFYSLQLIDPDGARPLSKNRRGMTVSEGAAMLLLVAGIVAGLFWAVKSGQFDDLEGPAQQIIMDEEVYPEETDEKTDEEKRQEK